MRSSAGYISFHTLLEKYLGKIVQMRNYFLGKPIQYVKYMRHLFGRESKSLIWKISNSTEKERSGKE